MSADIAGFCVCCGHQLAEYTAAPGTLGLVCRECADPMPPGSVSLGVAALVARRS